MMQFLESLNGNTMVLTVELANKLTKLSQK